MLNVSLAPVIETELLLIADASIADSAANLLALLMLFAALAGRLKTRTLIETVFTLGCS